MRILIIEDEHKIANSVKQGLEQEGFVVDVEYSGTDGYDMASTEEYDLVLLDLMLPGMNGIEICQKLREDNIHIPILMLTAKGELDDKIKGLNSGADDYLPKPFAFTELLARIRALLRRPKELVPDKLSCGDLTIDTQNFSVRRGITDISLSRKEFTLLEYLMRNQNHVMTKDKIIEHVWSYESNVLPNTVEVYIGYLRNKIDKPFKKQKDLLETVRGFGYVIRCTK